MTGDISTYRLEVSDRERRILLFCLRNMLQTTLPSEKSREQASAPYLSIQERIILEQMETTLKALAL